MAVFRSLSTSEQVAAHLRGDLMSGKLSGVMPGVLRLEKELGVNRKTVEAALRLLETEKLLVPQGPGRRRLIKLPKHMALPSLRLAILLGEAADRKLDYLIELRHELAEHGHSVFYAAEHMVDLRMDVKRIAGLVGKTGADAWVVASASREVLEWFSGQEVPAFAMFGRRRGLPIAGVGPDKKSAYQEVTRALIQFGHRRIVLLVRPRRRLPGPGEAERAFLGELATHGITSGPYHLPDWEESTEGFHKRLEALFHVTPPTALMVDEVPLFVAALQFCASRGLRVPQDVSLVCTDYDPDFDWCRPSVSHIRWDSGPVVRRIVRWAANVSQGREDKRQTMTPAEFIPGGTIGPAKED